MSVDIDVSRATKLFFFCHYLVSLISLSIFRPDSVISPNNQWVCGMQTEIYRCFDQRRGTVDNETKNWKKNLLRLQCESLFHRTASEIRLLGWNVPPDELKTIPEHWLTYPEPDPSLNYLLGLLYIGFTIVALIGNGLVIWVFSW